MQEASSGNSGGRDTHLSVCFVSGYLGFSAGRFTRGVQSMSGGLKIEVCFSTTISGTLVPPKRIGVRSPATWKPVASIALADGAVSRALAAARDETAPRPQKSKKALLCAKQTAQVGRPCPAMGGRASGAGATELCGLLYVLPTRTYGSYNNHT